MINSNERSVKADREDLGGGETENSNIEDKNKRLDSENTELKDQLAQEEGLVSRLEQGITLELTFASERYREMSKNIDAIYKADPREKLRAQVALLEADIKKTSELIIKSTLTKALQSEKATITSEKTCSNCGTLISGPANFCAGKESSCGATFLTEEMISKKEFFVTVGTLSCLPELENVRQKLNVLDGFIGNEKREIQEVEKDEEYIYNNYLQDLGLIEEVIQNKTILDVGAGNRNFAGHCLRKNINSDIYSLDEHPYIPNIENLEDENRQQKIYLNQVLKSEERAVLDAKTIKASREKIPLSSDSIDLIVLRAAMPGFQEVDSELIDREIEETFNELTRVLKVGGEARLYPFFFHGDYDKEKRGEWVKKIKNKIDTLVSSGKYSIVIERAGKLNKETTSRIILKKLEIAQN